MSKGQIAYDAVPNKAVRQASETSWEMTVGQTFVLAQEGGYGSMMIPTKDIHGYSVEADSAAVTYVQLETSPPGFCGGFQNKHVFTAVSEGKAVIHRKITGSSMPPGQTMMKMVKCKKTDWAMVDGAMVAQEVDGEELQEVECVHDPTATVATIEVTVLPAASD